MATDAGMKAFLGRHD